MKVLVALDGSEIGESALRAIAPWARAAETEVYLLSVLHPRQVHETFSAKGAKQSLKDSTPTEKLLGVAEPWFRSAEDRSQAMARTRASAEDYLHHVAAEFLPGVSSSIHIEWGESTAAAIAEFARSFSVDFIAMGTHGRKGVSHALMGSVAEEVMRRSTVPVLMVRHGMQVDGVAPLEQVAR
jgi:nucleotide-binding universal stress UspA family protein